MALGEILGVPFPAAAHLRLLVVLSAGDFSAGDAKGRVELSRDKKHKDCEEKLCKLAMHPDRWCSIVSYLEGHAETDKDKDLLGVIECLEATLRAGLGSAGLLV